MLGQDPFPSCAPYPPSNALAGDAEEKHGDIDILMNETCAGEKSERRTDDGGVGERQKQRKKYVFRVVGF